MRKAIHRAKASKKESRATARRASSPLPCLPNSDSMFNLRDWLCHGDAETVVDLKSQQDTANRSAVGFLGVLDQEAERRLATLSRTKVRRVPSSFASRPVILSQIESLCTLFPDFPLNAMKVLIIRENGNCFQICNQLLLRGWGSKGLKQAHSFKDEEDIHFSEPYYHGVAPSDAKLERIFQNASPGTFITYYRIYGEGFRYYIYYKNQQGKLIEKGTTFPVVPQIIRKGMELHHFIPCKRLSTKAIPYFL